MTHIVETGDKIEIVKRVQSDVLCRYEIHINGRYVSDSNGGGLFATVWGAKRAVKRLLRTRDSSPQVMWYAYVKGRL